MTQKRTLVGFSACLIVLGACDNKSSDTVDSSSEPLELRVVDVEVIDATTGRPPLTTDGYRISPSEGFSHARLSEIPLRKDESGPLSFRITWIAAPTEEHTVLIDVNGYEPMILEADQLLRVGSDFMTARDLTVSVKIRPLAEQGGTGQSSPVGELEPSNNQKPKPESSAQ